MLLLGSPWQNLALWQTQFLSKSCEEVIPNSTCPSPSSTDWIWHRQVNLSQVMVAAVIWNCYTAEVGGIIILPRTGFPISQFQSSLASLRRKKSRRMCRLPLAHYTKQWNCLFLLCLLGFFTQSSPSHDAVLWFHFVGRQSYPIPKKTQWKWRKWGWNDAL